MPRQARPDDRRGSVVRGMATASVDQMTRLEEMTELDVWDD